MNDNNEPDITTNAQPQKSTPSPMDSVSLPDNPAPIQTPPHTHSKKHTLLAALAALILIGGGVFLLVQSEEPAERADTSLSSSPIDNSTTAQEVDFSNWTPPEIFARDDSGEDSLILLETAPPEDDSEKAGFYEFKDGSGDQFVIRRFNSTRNISANNTELSEAEVKEVILEQSPDLVDRDVSVTDVVTEQIENNAGHDVAQVRVRFTSQFQNEVESEDGVEPEDAVDLYHQWVILVDYTEGISMIYDFATFNADSINFGLINNLNRNLTLLY